MKSIINLSEYQKLQAKLETESKKVWEAYTSIRKRSQELLSELINLEGKYLKVRKDLEYTLYVFVKDQYLSKNDCNTSIRIRGVGFYSSISQYRDSTFMDWDADIDYEIKLDEDFESSVKDIEEITETEYNVAFENMLSDIREEHYRILKN